jgi:tetratricopeptide (TPR) repeat protein
LKEETLLIRCAILPIILHCVILACCLNGQAETTEEKAERARVAMVEERFDEAAAIYEELVKVSPDSAGLRMSLGIALQARGQYAKAATEFRFVVKQEPEFAAAWRVLGNCYSKLGDKDKAVASLARAVELEPRSNEVRLDYATALLSAKKVEQASGEFWKIAQIDQSEPRVWHGLAVSNAALAKAEKDDAKKQEFRERAARALEQLKETAGPEDDELLQEASKAVMEAKP